MEKDKFIEYISKQLQQMSMDHKDAWILTKAKLILESEQQDFIMSLSGEKKITYMPTEAEIETFCKKVQKGDIYVEYETHYYEFDSNGRYVDDWYVHHNDPQKAFSFLDRVFRGCHDLMTLGEYDLAGSILDKVSQLEFQVVEAEDSEDFEDDSPFTIVDARNEQLLSMDTREIGYDWIRALLLGKENNDSIEFAKKIADILRLEMCKDVHLYSFYEVISKELLNYIEEILEKEIDEINLKLEKVTDRNRHWRDVYTLEEKRARNQHLLLDIRKNCKKQSYEIEMPAKVSILQSSWEQISELFQILRYERYIDDQLEIDEVWKICEALIKRNSFGEEDWTIRKRILKDMISHKYYDCYGCYDPIKELAEKLYITDTEILEFADMLNEYDHYAKEAASIYRRYGRLDLYIRYLETHLDKSSEEYVELIRCYCNDNNESGARKIAELGLEKCKDDLTEFFIFLLKNAKKCGDEERYKKLLASAKRRKKADIARINKAIMQ